MPYGSLLVGPRGDVLAEDRNTVVDRAGHLGASRAQAGPVGGSRSSTPTSRGRRRCTRAASRAPCALVRSPALASAALSSRSPASSCSSSSRPAPPVPDDSARSAYEGPALFAEARDSDRGLLRLMAHTLPLLLGRRLRRGPAHRQPLGCRGRRGRCRRLRDESDRHESSTSRKPPSCFRRPTSVPSGGFVRSRQPASRSAARVTTPSVPGGGSPPAASCRSLHDETRAMQQIADRVLPLRVIGEGGRPRHHRHGARAT